MDRMCRYCERKIFGRSDKIYCDSFCRNASNNTQTKPGEEFIKSINKKLRKNRSILKKLNPVGNAYVEKEVMVNLGFDFSCFTSIYLSSRKKIYYLCYEFAYSPVIDGNVRKILIVPLKERMLKWDPWNYAR